MHDLNFRSRVDQIVEYFTNAVSQINLGLLYFHEPDYSGHRFGPEREKIMDVIVELDQILGYLIEQLELHGLYEVGNDYMYSMSMAVSCY